MFQLGEYNFTKYMLGFGEKGTWKVPASYILFMEEILHHLGWLKPYKEWDNHHPWWCRILSISSTCPRVFELCKCRVGKLQTAIHFFTHKKSTSWTCEVQIQQLGIHRSRGTAPLQRSPKQGHRAPCPRW